MPTPFRIGAAVAAILVILVGAGVFIGVGAPAPGLPASASPTATPGSVSFTPRAYVWPGRLDPGAYRTSLVWDLPFAFEFVVPVGWDAFDVEMSKPASNGLSVEFALVDNVFADPCAGVPLEPPVGASVESLADAVEAIPGLDVTAVGPVTLDRVTAGTTLDYAIREDAGCAPGDFLLWAMSEDRIIEGSHFGGADKSLTAAEGRIWIVDVDGTRVAIRTTWGPEATPAERAELQAIVDSIGVARPGETPPPLPSAP